MFSFKYYFILLIFLGFFTSCQTSSTKEVHSTKETITKTTPLTTEILRVSMQDTSKDNIIDKSNCFMIKFPYLVTVNNVPIPINSASDYQLVKNNINAFSTDNDIVNIHFPITVIFSDYTQKIINSKIDFEVLISNCQVNPNDFGKINCLTINYPIAINMYDTNYQIASSISIIDNLALYNFITNLANNKFIAISYPISVKDQNGQNVVVTTNSQFEDIIKSAVDNCSDPMYPPLDFMQIITNNTWKIVYYYHDNEKTSIYDGCNFTFSDNNKVVAIKSGITYKGTWSTKLNNGVREFEIKFESDYLKILDEGWKVFEFSNFQLRFRDKESNADNDYLYFEKK